jgi:hypothetical protein
MTLETYWMAVPLIGIALSGFAWLALFITRRREPRDHQTGRAANRL